jgi:hypothetical protein
MIYKRKLGTNTHEKFLDHLKRYVVIKQEKRGTWHTMEAR